MIQPLAFSLEPYVVARKSPQSLTTRGTPRVRAWWPGHPLFTRAQAADRQRASMRRYHRARRAKLYAAGLTAQGKPRTK